ncbi:hypothetical protein NliqN6_1045 [Naganishia liquefaciens]|uniref:Uncharacterized protein n=1 Tax=Naganishia liquefaciens TaxID=104408 RepID=A0A8H3TP79_9TREE|nr:hypothetical protein NliqN6_1045 [Naganishia liquefaciens]
MEMRPWNLRRSVTTSQNQENVKPPLLRCNTIASSRPTKRKAMSADMGSRGKFQGFTVIQSSETSPQITSSSRSTKPRPPPLRELPPPSWSSPGHSPPLTSLAPPFSRDMFLFPIKNSVNLSPVSPIYHRPFSTMMSPPWTPETKVAKSDSSTRAPIVPSALSTSHLGPAHYLDIIDSDLLTVNRQRRRSSMSSFGSTTATIRPWDVCGEITPKASKTQLVAEAIEAEPCGNQDCQDPRGSLSVQQCEAKERRRSDATSERDDRFRKTEKRSRLEAYPQDTDKVVEQTKNARRRAEGRKVSGALRL